MSKETKANGGLEQFTLRLTPALAKELRKWKMTRGVTIQHFLTTIIAAELGVNPQTGKPARKGDAK